MPERLKTKDMVSVFKKILYPMGYIVTLKPEEKEVIEWTPEEKSKYEKKDSEELEKSINTFKSQLSEIEKRNESIKETTLKILDESTPNEATKELYNAPHQSKPTITKNNVIVVSERAETITKTITYLESLKMTKQKEEILKKLQSKKEGVIDLKIERNATGQHKMTVYN